MKTTIISFTFICILFSILSTGCDRMNKAIDNAIRFDSIQLNESSHLLNDTSYPACNIQISFVYPDSADKQVLNRVQEIFVEKVFGDSFKDLSPQQAIVYYSKQYIQAFKSLETNLYPEPPFVEIEENSEYQYNSGFFYYTIIKNALVYNQNNFISFTVENISYEGGTRSSRSLNGYVINLNTGQLLQEEDFAGINYAQNISPVLAAKIAGYNHLENPADLENLGYYPIDEIVPNNNFTIDNNGITYYFNVNEIGDVMVGLSQVFIPYEEINIYMKKENPIAFLSR